MTNKAVTKAREEVVQIQNKADTFERELKSVKAQQEQFSKQLKIWTNKQKQLTEKQLKLQEDLKNVSPESKTYLDTPIPDDVRRVLDSIFE